MAGGLDRADIAFISRHRRARSRSRDPRGPRGPRNGVTATATIDQLLRTKGPLDASEIIATVACEGSNVQVTSVRTLISAMAKKGVIVKTGSRGTYKYEAAPVAVSAAE